MDNTIERITIVGGGTAGWLTAMTLNQFLNRLSERPPIKVTVIESPKVPTVGVGEATVPGMARLLQHLDIDEAEFFRRCNASFKLGVRFENWALDGSGGPIDYIHPFNYPLSLAGFPPAHHFNKFGPHAGCETLAECMVPNTSVIESCKGPRRIGGKNYENEIGYAYHLDAGLFGQYLKEVAISRGVRHIVDDVEEVVLDDRGFVGELRLERGGNFPVEFIVDCTGFKGLILQQTLGEQFQPFSDHLLCDRAIPVQIPHRDVRRLPPCTRSSALGAGWVWRVPLFSRIGTGYVFSSAFRSDDEARAEFFQHIRAIGDLGPDDPDPDTRVIHMKIGRTRRSWVKNCVAIGLAGGFIEPLESTAIYMIEMGARWLVGHLPDRQVNPAFAQRYNKLMESLHDEVRDFIVSHYYTSNRPEPFWHASRSDIVVPDSLQENLDLWRHALPSSTDTSGCRLFNYWNYTYTLLPKGYFEGRHFPLEGATSRSHWDRFGARLAQTKAEMLPVLPNHYDLLTHIREGASAPAAKAGPPPEFVRRATAQPTVPLP